VSIDIIDLNADNMPAIEQVAALLVAGFKTSAPTAWPDMPTALSEVQESFGADRISRVALGENKAVVGWIAGYSVYGGNVWELHPPGG
jgi:aminoglycoside 6'-N-acetyltransferase I